MAPLLQENLHFPQSFFNFNSLSSTDNNTFYVPLLSFSLLVYRTPPLSESAFIQDAFIRDSALNEGYYFGLIEFSRDMTIYMPAYILNRATYTLCMTNFSEKLHTLLQELEDTLFPPTM